MRKANRHTRALALVLCACLLAALAGSALYLSAHSHHHCDGPACTVCLHLRQAQQLFQRLGLAAGFAISALVTAAATFLLPLLGGRAMAATTLVRNRVRLND